MPPKVPVPGPVKAMVWEALPTATDWVTCGAAV